MGLDNYVFLGSLPDDEEAEETQEEVNERTLNLCNQSQLIDAVEKRVSKSEFIFLMENLKESNEEYWMTILMVIIKEYALNPLKLYLAEGFGSINKIDETKKLLMFIKLKLIDAVFEKSINLDIDRESFTKFVYELEPPKFMKITLRYVDNDSLKILIKRLIKESKSEYETE